MLARKRLVSRKDYVTSIHDDNAMDSLIHDYRM